MAIGRDSTGSDRPTKRLDRMSSLKGIRSRLRYSAGTDSEKEGSPSRSSFFQQLTSFLGPEDAVSSQSQAASNNNAAEKGPLTFSPEVFLAVYILLRSFHIIITIIIMALIQYLSLPIVSCPLHSTPVPQSRSVH